MILPLPDPSFSWRDTVHGPALVCAPLEALAPHMFTTRAWTLGRIRDAGASGWAELAEAASVPASALIRLTQVHGHATVVAEQLQAGGGPPEADIVTTAAPHLAVAVQAADCVPLLLADRRLGVVAAAHAGWRGLAQGVPAAAVRAMAEQYGSRPVDLVAAIGPSVGACCYEVGPDVRDAFATGGFEDRAARGWFHERPAPTMGNQSMPGLPSAARAGHAYFDGWAAARAMLVAAGVPDAAVHTARLCTASHSDVLCSYRRDGTRAGRIVGVIRPSGQALRPGGSAQEADSAGAAATGGR